MCVRQIFGGSTPPKYLTDECPSNISRMSMRQLPGGCRPPKYLTDVCPSNIWGSTPPKSLTDVCPSNIWGVYRPQIFHGWGSVKYLGGVQPPNISRNPIREIFWGSTPPKYFTDGVPSNIWGVHTPKIFDRWGSVKYLGGLHPQNISRMWFRQIFGGCTPPKYFTDGVPSNIWGL